MQCSGISTEILHTVLQFLLKLELKVGTSLTEPTDMEVFPREHISFSIFGDKTSQEYPP